MNDVAKVEPQPHSYIRIPLSARILAIGVIAAVACTAAITLVERSSSVHVTAYFTNSIGLYEGDRVMVRGVQVGTVDTIRPTGDRVAIEMSIDNRYGVSSDAGAAIVAPTLVTGRYVQLVSVSDGTGELEDGDEIALEKTAVPVEYDQVKKQLRDLTNELGPVGFNADGSLSALVESTATALDGSGVPLRQALTNVSDAVQTLARSGPDLFGTVRNLQVLVSALAERDRQIEGFTTKLASVSSLLNDNRTQLDTAVTSIAALLPEIETYVAENGDKLTANVQSLNSIATLLMNRQDDLAQILHVTPTALADLYNIYDPSSNSLTGALAIPDVPDPMSFICALLTTVDAPQQECSRASASFGDLFGAAMRANGVPPASGPDTTPANGLNSEGTP